VIPVKDTSSKGFSFVTFLIIIANFAMFYEEAKTGKALFELFGVSPKDVFMYLIDGKGSLIRINVNIFASSFMHAGYIHLLSNMLFLYVFGPSVEKEFGWMRFVVFYTCAIYVSFYSHAFLNHGSDIIVVGASGAIAAIMGAFVILKPRAKITSIIPILFIIKIAQVPAFLFILIWFALQGLNGYLTLGTQTSIAWMSHIGGFVMGMICGILFKLDR
jgi:membrane associated rhomboid family serine protease